MKNLFLSLMTLFLCLNTSNAQDTKTAFRNAQKNMSVYNVNNNNRDLAEAARQIDVTLSSPGSEEYTEAKAWLLKGEIYSAVATKVAAARQYNLGDAKELEKIKSPALEAVMAYSRALQLAEKTYEQKEAQKGLMQLQSTLQTAGVISYEDQNYEQSYSEFQSVIDLHQFFKESGLESSLDDADNYNHQVYITGLAAFNAGNLKKAKLLFEELYQKKYWQPVIFEMLYTIEAEQSSPQEAYHYLESGREKFPEDVALLFAEINHFLKLNQTDKLVDKLEKAIEKEPENISLYATLGNVYDNIFQQKMAGGDKASADQYFDKALKYYSIAIEKDPGYFDAIYSLGALYFNHAAVLTSEIQGLDDTSEEDMKLYEQKVQNINADFDQAMPYFKRAEQLNPNDVNTLIALQEILLRKDAIDDYRAIKSRLDKVRSGQVNAGSYYKTR